MRKTIQEIVEAAVKHHLATGDNISDSLRAVGTEGRNFSHLHKKVSKLVKESSTSSNVQESVEEKWTESGKTYTYNGFTKITSEDEAIDHFKIDTTKWEIVNPTFKHWNVTIKSKSGLPIGCTNYSASIPLQRKSPKVDFSELIKFIDDYTPQLSPAPKSTYGKKVGLAAIADLHVGASTKKSRGTLLTKDFNLKILLEYMDEAVDLINDIGDDEVHVAILGDLVETITGLNHPNSWQGIEEDLFGGNAIIFAHKVLDRFLRKIKNLNTVYLVSGNHDRMTSSNKEDVRGEVTKVVDYMLRLTGYKTMYHPLVLNPTIDGIKYIMSHGDKSFIKQAIDKTILDYGDSQLYNVVLSGHLHSRQVKKDFFTLNYILKDDHKHRAIVVPPLFTGNYYSEGLGYSSTAGLTYLRSNSRKNNVHHFDYGLSGDSRRQE